MNKGYRLIKYRKEILLEIDTDLLPIKTKLDWKGKKITVGKGALNCRKREDGSPMYRFLYYDNKQ